MAATDLKELIVILWYLFLICLLIYVILAVVVSIVQYIIKQIKYEKEKKDLVNTFKNNLEKIFIKDKK